MGQDLSRVTTWAQSAIDQSRVTPRARIHLEVSHRRRPQLVLSLWPGIDLLGRGFEESGFTVVRGPDLIFGGDIRTFSVPRGRFDGIIAGTPCPDFSRARRGRPSGIGVEMLQHFARIVREAGPDWWLLENVPACPDVRIDGYSHQRIDIDARDLGVEQMRLRHFQWGHSRGLLLALPRPRLRPERPAPTCLTRPDGRSFSRFCQLQGLPPDFDLPSFTIRAKYRAVGNGVHLDVARFLASGVVRPVVPGTPLCQCGCARPLIGRATAKTAGPACRKRMQRRRKRDTPAAA